jgi:hypothetical protein
MNSQNSWEFNDIVSTKLDSPVYQPVGYCDETDVRKSASVNIVPSTKKRRWEMSDTCVILNMYRQYKHLDLHYIIKLTKNQPSLCCEADKHFALLTWPQTLRPSYPFYTHLSLLVQYLSLSVDSLKQPWRPHN